MPDPRHIFISYSRKDNEVMQRVKQSLLERHWAVWTDEGIAPGTDSWQAAIEQAIEAAGCIVVLLSPDAKKSLWVRRELNYALAQKIQIFPLMVQGSEATSVPLPLIGAQYVDIQPDYDAGMGRLLLALERVFGSSASVDMKVTKPLWEHIPTIEQAPIDYSKIKPVTRNRDWAPIIRIINGIEMCLVPPGCFMMGSEEALEDESPRHQECFENFFWIGRYPVTNALYESAVKANICQPSENADNPYFNHRKQPVIGVNWYEARKCAEWKQMRLATEAEWEYAARGPDNWMWPWGDTFVADNLIYRENSDNKPAIIGERLTGASWVGALDMSGNVWEWCATKWQESYHRPLNNNEQGHSPRVLRGGSWLNIYHFARCTSRNWYDPLLTSDIVGFRLVYDLAGQ